MPLNSRSSFAARSASICLLGKLYVVGSKSLHSRLNALEKEAGAHAFIVHQVVEEVQQVSIVTDCSELATKVKVVEAPCPP